MNNQNVKTLFLSDLHLGYWVSSAEQCLEILQTSEAQQLYLVGDILDESRLSERWFWPESHQSIIDELLRWDQRCDVFSVPGNHDNYLRRRDPLESLPAGSLLYAIVERMLEIRHQESFDFVMQDGRRLKVAHGDRFDDLEKKGPSITKFGSYLFDQFNWLLSRSAVIQLRQIFKWLLARPKRIEQRLIESAQAEGYDGIIFGHLHQPTLYQRERFIVANCGDWMLNRSFLIETNDGELELYNHGNRIASSAEFE